jgi:hypothetical protein
MSVPEKVVEHPFPLRSHRLCIFLFTLAAEQNMLQAADAF